MNSKIFDGITVLDASTYVSASFGTLMLANQGAEVIKIEPPGDGDVSRTAGPPFVNGESPYFLTVNYGKKSIQLDLKSDRGKEVLYNFVTDADAFVENFRPGTAERLGIDYETLSEHNEELIYCSVTAFGESGPWSHRPGYDLLMQGFSGIMSVTGEPDRPPVKTGIPLSDLTTGFWTGFGLAMALYKRLATGNGEYIELSMYESMLPLLTKQAGNVFAGENPRRMGSRDPVIAPYQIFEAKDGYVTVAVGSQKLWKSLCQTIDRGDLLEDDRFTTNANRVNHMEALESELSETFRSRSVDEWVTELMDEHGIPVGPMYTINEALENEHVAARGVLIDHDHPEVDGFPVVDHPLNYEFADHGFENHAPILGEDTIDVLHNAGYNEWEVATLIDAGVVGVPSEENDD